MVFDKQSNDNEIALNLNHYQSIREKTYLYTFFYFFRFFSYLFEISLSKTRDCQKLSWDGLEIKSIIYRFRKICCI
jgi:hypothetical protein